MKRKKAARKRSQESKRDSRWGLRGKTVWDWLPILGTFTIPVVIAIGGWWYAWQLDKVEEQRSQDEALQAYFDQMNQLLLEKNLRGSEADSEVRTLARAQTLTVLEGSDPDHRTQVLRFLIEAGLVQGGKEPPIISLRQANWKALTCIWRT